MAVANLDQALDRLRGDNSREASRIRAASLVVQAGDYGQIRKLCARGAGWDVPLRERGKKRPWLALTTELRGAILAAARRHLATGQAEPPSSLAAPAPTASASASAGQPDRISIAKRLLYIKPATEHTKRLRRSLDELATQPPRKKLRELAKEMAIAQMRGEADAVLHERLRDSAVNAVHDEPGIRDQGAPAQSPGLAAAHRTLRNPASSQARTTPRKTTDKMLKDYCAATLLAERLADRQEVLEMRLRSENLDPDKATEYRFLQQVGREFCLAGTREKLHVFADKCGFKRCLFASGGVEPKGERLLS